MTKPSSPVLKGVHHTARPTWKLKETVEFYRDVLGLELVHCLVAKGWPEGHPDFMHFFFDSGNGSTIAFFYYLNTDRPQQLEPFEGPVYDATHTAWDCGSSDELTAWQKHLETKKWPVKFRLRHEVVESIYMTDPNGYMIEIGFPTREFVALDGQDATTSMQAAIEMDEKLKAEGSKLSSIETIWARKGELLAQRLEGVA